VTLEGRAPSAADLAAGYCLGTPLRAEIEVRGDLATTATVVADEIRARLGDAWPVDGAIDCHAHVFERGFPFSPERGYDPLPYPLEHYLAWVRALGIARCVQVTASCYGLDNSVAAYAMEECRINGIGVRGVATIHPETGEVELEKLARSGFVGARVTTSRVQGVGFGELEAIAKRCEPLGWHLELNVDASDEWLALEPRLARLPVPAVIEHLGTVDSADAPGLRALLRLLEQRADFAVKLCSFHRIGAQTAASAVRLFAREYPDRLMWGSSFAPGGDDLAFISTALEWLPDAKLRTAVFSANAERFYRL
jgi:predicted TIM-barrel fold metal-dependent hydrolase